MSRSSYLNTYVNVIKLFTAVSYDFSQKARAFVPDKLFQPSLNFVGKARSLQRVEHLKHR